VTGDMGHFRPAFSVKMKPALTSHSLGIENLSRSQVSEMTKGLKFRFQ